MIILIFQLFCLFLTSPKQNEDDDVAEGSSAPKRSSSCVSVQPTQRWNIYLIIIAVILIIFFFIIPDFIIIWELELRKQVQNLLKQSQFDRLLVPFIHTFISQAQLLQFFSVKTKKKQNVFILYLRFSIYYYTAYFLTNIPPTFHFI